MNTTTQPLTPPENSENQEPKLDLNLLDAKTTNKPEQDKISEILDNAINVDTEDTLESGLFLHVAEDMLEALFKVDNEVFTSEIAQQAEIRKRLQLLISKLSGADTSLSDISELKLELLNILLKNGEIQLPELQDFANKFNVNFNQLICSVLKSNLDQKTLKQIKTQYANKLNKEKLKKLVSTSLESKEGEISVNDYFLLTEDVEYLKIHSLYAEVPEFLYKEYLESDKVVCAKKEDKFYILPRSMNKELKKLKAINIILNLLSSNDVPKDSIDATGINLDFEIENPSTLKILELLIPKGFRRFKNGEHAIKINNKKLIFENTDFSIQDKLKILSLFRSQATTKDSEFQEPIDLKEIDQQEVLSILNNIHNLPDSIINSLKSKLTDLYISDFKNLPSSFPGVESLTCTTDQLNNIQSDQLENVQEIKLTGEPIKISQRIFDILESKSKPNQGILFLDGIATDYTGNEFENIQLTEVKYSDYQKVINKDIFASIKIQKLLIDQAITFKEILDLSKETNNFQIQTIKLENNLNDSEGNEIEFENLNPVDIYEICKAHPQLKEFTDKNSNNLLEFQSKISGTNQITFKKGIPQLNNSDLSNFCRYLNNYPEIDLNVDPKEFEPKDYFDTTTHKYIGPTEKVNIRYEKGGKKYAGFSYEAYRIFMNYFNKLEDFKSLIQAFESNPKLVQDFFSNTPGFNFSSNFKLQDPNKTEILPHNISTHFLKHLPLRNHQIFDNLILEVENDDLSDIKGIKNSVLNIKPNQEIDEQAVLIFYNNPKLEKINVVGDHTTSFTRSNIMGITLQSVLLKIDKKHKIEERQVKLSLTEDNLSNFFNLEFTNIQDLELDASSLSEEQLKLLSSYLMNTLPKTIRTLNVQGLNFSITNQLFLMQKHPNLGTINQLSKDQIHTNVCKSIFEDPLIISYIKYHKYPITLREYINFHKIIDRTIDYTQENQQVQYNFALLRVNELFKLFSERTIIDFRTYKLLKDKFNIDLPNSFIRLDNSRSQVEEDKLQNNTVIDAKSEVIDYENINKYSVIHISYASVAKNYEAFMDFKGAIFFTDETLNSFSLNTTLSCTLNFKNLTNLKDLNVQNSNTNIYFPSLETVENASIINSSNILFIDKPTFKGNIAIQNSPIDFQNAIFEECNLSNSNFIGSKMSNAEFDEKCTIPNRFFRVEKTLIGPGLNLTGSRNYFNAAPGLNLDLSPNTLITINEDTDGHQSLYLVVGKALNCENIKAESVEFNNLGLDYINFEGSILTLSNFIESSLVGANVSSCDLFLANFKNSDLRQADLSRSNLIFANLEGANLVGSNLLYSDLRNAYLQNANLQDSSLQGVDLRQANLEGADLRGANLEGADLRGLDLSDVKLTGANLTGANLEGANLDRASLIWTTLQEANLNKLQQPPNPSESYDITKNKDGTFNILPKVNSSESEVTFLNTENHIDIGPNLSTEEITTIIKETETSNANLRRAHLRGQNLQDKNFSNSDLSYSILSYTKLNNADLSKANLEGADLRQADLQGADLRQADLQGANLRGANLQGADLQGADLKGANLKGAKLINLKTAPDSEYLPDDYRITNNPDGTYNIELIQAQDTQTELASTLNIDTDKVSILTESLEQNSNKDQSPDQTDESNLRSPDLQVPPQAEQPQEVKLEKQQTELASTLNIDPDKVSIPTESLEQNSNTDQRQEQATESIQIQDQDQSQRLELATQNPPQLEKTDIYSAAENIWRNLNNQLLKDQSHDNQQNNPVEATITSKLKSLKKPLIPRLSSQSKQQLQEINKEIDEMKVDTMQNADLSNLDLRNLVISYFSLIKTNFSNSLLNNTNLSQNLLRDANFTNSDLTNSNLSQSDLTGADLTNAKLKNANLSGANLEGADLSGVDLSKTNLELTRLVNLKNPPKKIPKEYSIFEITKNRKTSYTVVGPKLNLKGANLSGANLEGANLSEAKLKGVFLDGADLTGANLEGANLSEAKLKGVFLDGADLTGANLSEANIQYTHFRETIVKDTDFTNTKIKFVEMKSIDFSSAKLENAILEEIFVTERNLETIVLPQGYFFKKNEETRNYQIKKQDS